MNSDDLKRLFLGPTLFRLDTVLATRLVPILYGVGLVSLLVWAINHLFATFGSNFGNGLWGLVEIITFGLLWLIILRVVCEAILVFFKAHETATESVSRTRISSTLLEDVREAIHDLADAESDTVTITEPVHTPPSPAPPSSTDDLATSLPQRGPVVRRTAKRTPPPPPKTE